LSAKPLPINHISGEALWLPPADSEQKVSTKYIDLTQQKLEITRLPHEQSEPNSVDWWEPKPLVEPLIDFW